MARPGILRPAAHAPPAPTTNYYYSHTHENNLIHVTELVPNARCTFTELLRNRKTVARKQ